MTEPEHYSREHRNVQCLPSETWWDRNGLRSSRRSQHRPEHPCTRDTIHISTLRILARLWQTEYVKFAMVLLAGIRAGRALRSSNYLHAPFVNPSRFGATGVRAGRPFRSAAQAQMVNTPAFAFFPLVRFRVEFVFGTGFANIPRAHTRYSDS